MKNENQTLMPMDKQDTLLISGQLRTCANCEHVDFKNNKCTLFNSKPPISFVVKGCDKWLLLIPF